MCPVCGHVEYLDVRFWLDPSPKFKIVLYHFDLRFLTGHAGCELNLFRVTVTHILDKRTHFVTYSALPCKKSAQSTPFKSNFEHKQVRHRSPVTGLDEPIEIGVH